MNYIDSDQIENALEVLNASGLEWILLRNSGDELPEKLNPGKDIDVLMKSSDALTIHDHLTESGFSLIPHPFRHDVRLYEVHEFKKYSNSYGILIDINFEIVVRSLDQGQWIPLDQEIQYRAWSNRIFTRIGNVRVPILGNEELFVSTLARCVFDKKLFSVWHQNMLYKLFMTCDQAKLKAELGLIFFGYTDRMLSLVRERQFDIIIKDYISCADY